MSPAELALVLGAAAPSAAALGLIVRLARRWQRIEDRLGSLDDDLAGVARELAGLSARITWLERQLVYQLSRRPPPE